MQSGNNLSIPSDTSLFRTFLLNALEEKSALLDINTATSIELQCHALLLTVYDQPVNLLLFVDIWLNKIDKIDDIVNQGKFIQQSIKNTILENLTPIIQKQCTLQIILILFKKLIPESLDFHNTTCFLNNPRQSSAEKIQNYCLRIMARFAAYEISSHYPTFIANIVQKHSNNVIDTLAAKSVLVSKETREFMNEHRYPHFFGRWGRTSTIKMLEYLEQGQFKSAAELLSKEVQNFSADLEQQFNIKLTIKPH